MSANTPVRPSISRREPRLFGSVSHEHLKEEMRQYGVKLSDYEGPGSFASVLLKEAKGRGVEMIMDGHLHVAGDLYLLGGTHRDAFRMPFDDWFALVQPRVRHSDFGGFHNLVAKQQQIEIDRPRTPALASLAAQLSFDLQ